MSVSLSKGGNVSLTKIAPSLRAVSVGLGWDVRATAGADFDLDSSALLCDTTERVVDDAHFVFFNNLASPDGAVEHLGDNTTGQGDGDDEVIAVDLTTLSPAVVRIVFAVSIYQADERQQSFGQVVNAFIRVVDRTSGDELVRFDLTEDASTETAMVFGEVYRHGVDWKFRAVGQGYAEGLSRIAKDFGVNVA